MKMYDNLSCHRSSLFMRTQQGMGEKWIFSSFLATGDVLKEQQQAVYEEKKGVPSSQYIAISPKEKYTMQKSTALFPRQSNFKHILYINPQALYGS